jgi:hypothetical protein
MKLSLRATCGGTALIFELVTGVIGDDTHFLPHGHSVTFRVESA